MYAELEQLLHLYNMKFLQQSRNQATRGADLKGKCKIEISLSQMIKKVNLFKILKIEWLLLKQGRIGLIKTLI